MLEGNQTMSVVLPVSIYAKMLNRKQMSGESLATIYRRGVEMYLKSVSDENTIDDQTASVITAAKEGKKEN